MVRSLSFKFVVIISILVGVLYSCESGCGHKTKCRNFICVVDFSSTINSQERQEFYLSVIKNNVIKQLEMTDRLTVIPVDKASVTNSSEILISDLSTKDFVPDAAPPMEEDKLTKDNLEKYKDTISMNFELSFRKAVSDRTLQNKGTDLLGAMNNVKGYIKSNDDNYVIFMSDMMNYTKTLNMEPSNDQFTLDYIANILSKLPGIELQNTTTLVITGDQPNVSTEHFELVKAFWTQYFSKNHVKIFDYSSASVSKLNDLMRLPVSK